MSDHTAGFLVELERSCDGVQLAIPPSIFGAAVEQLRWDALRAGRIGVKDWDDARAYIAPGRLDSEQTVVEFVLTVVCGGELLRRCCKPVQVQGLELFLRRQLGRSEIGDERSCRIRWAGGNSRKWGQVVPLGPRRLPLGQLPASWRPSFNGEPPAVLVDGAVQTALSRLGEETMRVGKELGACLVGRVTDPDTVRVEETVEAPSANASAAHFTFDTRFWVDLGRQIEQKHDHRVIGWVHTHLVEEGAPRGLSILDFVTTHRWFRSPWSVAALVCASSARPETRWFGWSQGNFIDAKASELRVGLVAGD